MQMFADHESSLNPIDVPRSWIWNLSRRTVYFGTSVSTIFKGKPKKLIEYSMLFLFRTWVIWKTNSKSIPVFRRLVYRGDSILLLERYSVLLYILLFKARYLISIQNAYWLYDGNNMQCVIALFMAEVLNIECII